MEYGRLGFGAASLGELFPTFRKNYKRQAALKFEAQRSLKMLANIYQSVLCNTPEDLNFILYMCLYVLHDLQVKWFFCNTNALFSVSLKLNFKV
jgi:hypothetical protein